MAEPQTSGFRDREPPEKSAPPKAGGTDDGRYKGRPLGRILIKMGKLNRTQVGEVLDLQKIDGRPFGRILVDLGYTSEADVQTALKAQVGQ